MSEPGVLRYFRLLRTYGLNHPTSGNASDQSGITPTGCSADNGVALVSWGSQARSQDWSIHQYCYEQRREIAAILHAHSPYTVAFGRSTAVHWVAAEWRTGKTTIKEALAEHLFILHLDHGVYAAAESPSEAYEMICAAEHAARTACIRRSL